jgi:hypothetical protein
MKKATYRLTTQAAIRADFWAAHPQFTRCGNQPQNRYGATIRSAFVEYVDYLCKSGDISAKLAARVTL